MSAAHKGNKRKKRLTYVIARVHMKVTEEDIRREMGNYIFTSTLLASGDGNPVYFDFCDIEQVNFSPIDGTRNFKKAIVYHRPMSDADRNQRLHGKWAYGYPSTMNIVERIMDDIFKSKNRREPLKVWPGRSRHFWMLLPNLNPRYPEEDEEQPPQLTANELVDKINNKEECIMSNYYDYSNTSFSGKCKAMLDEIADRYRKDIKVDETSFTAATEEELIKKLQDRLNDLERLNEVVYDSCDDFYLWEQYE